MRFLRIEYFVHTTVFSVELVLGCMHSRLGGAIGMSRANDTHSDSSEAGLMFLLIEKRLGKDDAEPFVCVLLLGDASFGSRFFSHVLMNVLGVGVMVVSEMPREQVHCIVWLKGGRGRLSNLCWRPCVKVQAAVAHVLGQFYVNIRRSANHGSQSM